MFYNVPHCSEMQCSVCNLLNCSTPYVFYFTDMCCTVLYCSLLRCCVLFCIALRLTLLHHSILCFTALYFSVMCFSLMFHNVPVTRCPLFIAVYYTVCISVHCIILMHCIILNYHICSDENAVEMNSVRSINKYQSNNIFCFLKVLT